MYTIYLFEYIDMVFISVRRCVKGVATYLRTSFERIAKHLRTSCELPSQSLKGACGAQLRASSDARSPLSDKLRKSSERDPKESNHLCWPSRSICMYYDINTCIYIYIYIKLYIYIHIYIVYYNILYYIFLRMIFISDLFTYILILYYLPVV